jgi:hypothetical protein
MDNPILIQLLQLLRDLYGETRGFLDRPDDAQLWYNRGYADGMIQAMRDLGYGSELPPELLLEIDGETGGLVAQQALTPWGRAHAHGLEIGRRETFEVLEAN